MTAPEPPAIKKMFLLKLAFASQLGQDALLGLLDSYEREVEVQIHFYEEKRRRETATQVATGNDTVISTIIHENVMAFYYNEAEWVRSVRDAIAGKNKEEIKMNYRTIRKGEHIVFVFDSKETPIRTERDASDLVGVCMEHQTGLLLLHGDALT